MANYSRIGARSPLPNNGAQLIYPDGVETSIVAVDHVAIPSFIQQFIGNSFNLNGVKPAPREKTTLGPDSRFFSGYLGDALDRSSTFMADFHDFITAI